MVIMICEICRGEGRLDTLFGEKRPCPECNGSGVASCCDAAGSSAPPLFVCPACGAESFNFNDIAQRYCGRCHLFADDPLPLDRYRDDRFAERPCERMRQALSRPRRPLLARMRAGRRMKERQR